MAETTGDPESAESEKGGGGIFRRRVRRNPRRRSPNTSYATRIIRSGVLPYLYFYVPLLRTSPFFFRARIDGGFRL
jgi:hypothetical protein